MTKKLQIMAEANTCSSNKRLKINCDRCSVTFSTKGSLQRHQKHLHGIVRETPKTITCSQCSRHFSTMCDLKHHLKEHDISVSEMSLSFESEADFQQWKDETEKATSSYFVSCGGKKQRRDGSFLCLYRCHRSGCFVSKSTGKRASKLCGTNKIGSTCPSGIKCEVLPNGEVNVKYCDTHAGHTQEPGRLARTKCKSDINKEKHDVIEMQMALTAELHDSNDAEFVKMIKESMQLLVARAKAYKEGKDITTAFIENIKPKNAVEQKRLNSIKRNTRTKRRILQNNDDLAAVQTILHHKMQDPESPCGGDDS